MDASQYFQGRKYRFVEEGQFCDCTSLIDAGGMP